MKKNKLIFALSMAWTASITGCNSGDANENVVRNMFAVGDMFEGLEDGDPVEGNVATNDQGEDLTYSLNGSSMANGVLSFNDDGSFVYTPNPDFFGTDSVTYVATQTSTGETDTATLRINIVNDFETLDEYGWKVERVDEFDAETIDAQWETANASLAEGNLVLTASLDSPATIQSNQITRIDGNSVGRIEASIQIPEGKDVNSVFSLMPVSDSYNGKNTLFMLQGNTSGLKAGAHYGTGLTSAVKFNEDSVAASTSELHTYAIEWEPEQIRWYIDGYHVHTVNTLNLWGYTGEGEQAVIDNNGPFDQDLQIALSLSSTNADSSAQMLVDYVKVWTCDPSVATDITNCASAVKSSVSKLASDRIESLGPVMTEVFVDGYLDNNGNKLSDLTPLMWHNTDEIVEPAITNFNGPTIEIIENDDEHGLVIDVSHPDGDANVGIALPGVEIIGLEPTLSFDMYIDSANTTTETLDIRMETGWPYMGMLVWNVADLPLDTWFTYSIPVSEFVESPFLAPDWLTWLPGVSTGDPLPLDTSNVNSLLVIEFHGGIHMQLDNIKLSCISNESCVQSPMPVQVPAEYEPSTIYEAEEWDEVGGDVAIEDTQDSSGGQNVGWIDAGEYLVYTISAPVEGIYQMDYRLASGTGSDGFTMSINGQVIDTQTVENTGGWQNWVTQSSPEFNLTVGQHTVRFDFLGGGINFNYFELNSPLFEIFLEAESFDFSAAGVDVQTEETLDENGGLNVGWIDAGDYLEYDVNIPVTGKYKITYRVASNGGSEGFETSLNGTLVHTQTVADTGGWQNWSSVTAEVELEAGEQVLRLDFVGGAINVNWIQITN
ncbi:carbohydrate-binding protein [Thalassotalea litorea]|uniref:carbohydrate-binding protein n=1 Tax=Thalassotalea litorea TaxID=2020715 RepID=UPI00373690FA